MTEYTSIRVTKEAKEAAQESKADSETWNEYLQRCTDNPPQLKEFVEAESLDTGTDDLDEVKELMDKVKRLESMTREATNAAQSAERAAEELQR